MFSCAAPVSLEVLHPSTGDGPDSWGGRPRKAREVIKGNIIPLINVEINTQIIHSGLISEMLQECYWEIQLLEVDHERKTNSAVLDGISHLRENRIKREYVIGSTYE
jgi:hypothetical protein